jgi:hypothetical protein
MEKGARLEKMEFLDSSSLLLSYGSPDFYGTLDGTPQSSLISVAGRRCGLDCFSVGVAEIQRSKTNS